MNPTPQDNNSLELDEILGNTLGMWLVKEADGHEWLDAGEWHIGDGVDDCSGHDDVAQLKSYKEAKAQFQFYIDRKVREGRIDFLIEEQANIEEIMILARKNRRQNISWLGAWFKDNKRKLDDLRASLAQEGDNHATN